MAARRMARESEDREGGEGGGISGEYKRPDAKAAFKIYTNEIAPKQAHMQTIKGDLSDPYKRIKDDCHFPRKVIDFLVALDDMEEAKRDHWLLAINLGLQELKLTLPRDLVTMADGKDGGAIVPTGKQRARPNLVAVGDHPADDSDLAAGAADDSDDDDGDEADEPEFEEASDDELAQQAGRGEKRADEPQSGTGAAAIAAMKASAELPEPKGNA